MKILQLCKKFPSPLKDGESIAVNYLSKALAEAGCEVTLLSMNTSKHFVDLEICRDNYQHYKAVYTAYVNNDINAWGAMKNLFMGKSYHISRYVSEAFRDQLIKVLKLNEFDIVQLETLYLTPYINTIREYSNAKISLRAHNVEFEIWKRLTRNSHSFLRKKYLAYLTAKLKEYEVSQLGEIDCLVAVSQRDLETFKALGFDKTAICSPIGLNMERYALDDNATGKGNTICFIGAMDWMPNQEGIEWFIVKVWPMLYSRNPALELHIAGRNMPRRFLEYKSENIYFHGEINDAIRFINKYDFMIVPLFSGSGVRVKILEGMALEKVVVTTTLGKEGIDAKHNKHLMVADTPIEFTEAIEKLIQKDKKADKIKRKARKYIKKHYDNLKIAQDLLEDYSALLQDSDSSRENSKEKIVSA